MLRRFARHVLAAEGITPGCELSVVLCDEQAISELNCKFLGYAGPTDVLSFPQDTAPRLPAPPDESPALLGDVVICADIALAQSEKRKVSFEENTLDLLAHGILHLLGYPDDTPFKRRKMLKRQQELVMEFYGCEKDLSFRPLQPDSRRRQNCPKSSNKR
jgi:probable rRNA maturation factor